MVLLSIYSHIYLLILFLKNKYKLFTLKYDKNKQSCYFYNIFTILPTIEDSITIGKLWPKEEMHSLTTVFIYFLGAVGACRENGYKRI